MCQAGYAKSNASEPQTLNGKSDKPISKTFGVQTPLCGDERAGEAGWSVECENSKRKLTLCNEVRPPRSLSAAVSSSSSSRRSSSSSSKRSSSSRSSNPSPHDFGRPSSSGGGNVAALHQTLYWADLIAKTCKSIRLI